MAAIEELDDQAVLDLARRTDPLGVVSVYVDADPRDREAAAIDIGNRYRELQRRLADSPESDARVSTALERLAPQVQSLTSPLEPGRGRVAFAGLSDGWVLRLDSQMQVPNRVVLDDGPFIHPLLELLDEGRPAGVVLVSSDEARVLEWRLGRLRLLDRLEQEEVEAPHERAGQIGGGPSGQFHTPVREQRQAREQHRAERFLTQVAVAVADAAVEGGWQRVLVSGGERWTGVLADRLPESLQEGVIRETRVLTGLDQERLEDAVTRRLYEDHLEREQRLAERIRDAGLSGKAALGLSEVAVALNEGRVAHLVYDPEVRYTGSVGSDGAIYAGTETGLGGEVRPEPRLSERLVDRALETGARVSPVEGAARGALREADGIGALLRW